MKTLVLIEDELGSKVEIDGILIDSGKHAQIVDAKNAILTELAEQKHTLKPEDWHAICMVLVRGAGWLDHEHNYSDTGNYYREAYVRV